MTQDDVIALLRRRCEEWGSQASWAAAMRIPPAHVSDVLNGRRVAGANIVAALGLERVVTYRVRSGT